MYKDIADYGIIGDMHSVALVSKDGSIDYCSMPHIDSPTVFAALLDDEKGGSFKIQPNAEFESEQQYVQNTNVLCSVFKTKSGKARMLDYMPVSTQDLFEKESHILHRCLRVDVGEVDFILECYPRPNYAYRLPRISKEKDVFIISSDKQVFSLRVRTKEYKVIENEKDGILISFSLKQNESAHFDFAYGGKKSGIEKDRDFEETNKFWTGWLHNCIAGKCQFLGEYTDIVNRSLLTLKLLTFQPTGAIAAAATTSLPESVGHERNWDYRFAWLRDASFTLKALFALGHITEADGFIQWLHRAYKKYGSRNLQIMYSLEGESSLTEKTIDYFKGYKNSKPVRVGNAAYGQHQWDIYGEIMDTALRLSDYAGKIDHNLWPFFIDVCNLACKNWNKPDDGIWEARNGPFHFVYSKVMCWVALDRGIKIASRYGFSAPLKKWKSEKENIKKDVLEKGYDKELGSFVQYYGSKELDSSLLLIPLMEFLSFDDERVKGTIEACRKYLMKDGYMLRYTSADGLEGEEGAFILCNFWLAEALALSGRVDEAKDILKKTLNAANHLGLFSEEYDYKNKQMLGNFPQAFSHIGLINTVSAILNVQSRASVKQVHDGWSERMRKIIPLKIVLNKAGARHDETTEAIARQLKVALNNLQGAFFDVSEGRVDYERMRLSESYNDYKKLAEKLNFFNPLSLKSDEEKKSFWINIYNILIIHGVVELDIRNSVKEVLNFFNRIGYNIGKLYFTPDDIEHGILRANRPHPITGLKRFLWLDKRRAASLSRLDPRIHFALVCAASSCPPIEFYDAGRINEQLDIATKSFLNRKGIMFDQGSGALLLSPIFKWYAQDFGGIEEVLRFILRYIDDEKIKKYVSDNGRNLRVEYLPYDWNLNTVLA